MAQVISHLVFALSKVAQESWKTRQQRKQLTAKLTSLSPPEKAILATYLARATTTLSFDARDGVVGGLVAKKIIYRASNIPSSMLMFPYNLQPWVWDYLKETPEILDGASDDHWERERKERYP